MKNLGLALGVCWLVLSKTVEAGPPFITDDPEVPPVGGWEINVPFTLNRSPGSTQMQAPLVDMNYGLPQLQLEFDIPLAVVSDDRKGTNAGLGALLYGIKWRFYKDDKTQTQIGVYPQMFAPPEITSAGWAEAGRTTSYRYWRKRAGIDGRYTATSVIAYKLLSANKTIGTRAASYNAISLTG